MNAESIRVRNEAWSDWEGRLINGTFPLRRFLGSSNHSAVFLTEYKALNLLREVAVKFLPADNLHTEAQQLVQWGAAASISHPHLVRLFDAGRCQVGGRTFLFAVMEYAEQTLSEILPKRPLSADEVREMLPPALDALAFLHRNNLVHGHLKPTNIVVVNDQVKLTCDTVRSPGHSNTIVRTYLYDPPELAATGTSTAGDVWALGVTLVEALTQRYPVPDERSQTSLLPAGLPPQFIGTVRRCLSRAPANRPTVTELEALYKPAAPQPSPSRPPPAPPASSTRSPAAPPTSSNRSPASPPSSATRLPAPPVLSPAQTLPETEARPVPRKHSPRGRFMATALCVALLIVAAAWAVARFFLGTPNGTLMESDTTQAASDIDVADAGSGATATAEANTAGMTVSDGADAGEGAAAGSSRLAVANTATVAEEVGARSGAIQRKIDDVTADAGSMPAARGPASHGARSNVGSATPAAPRSGRSNGSSGPVLHQVLPDVSPDILNRINGHVVVKVRVLVDASGDVVGQFVENPGPSKFFARTAADAAAEWKFVPAESRDPRVWLLRFEFDHSGATVESKAAQ